MAMHPSSPASDIHAVADRRPTLRAEADLEEAKALLRRLLAAEDRIGLVFPVMDEARHFLAAQRRRRD